MQCMETHMVGKHGSEDQNTHTCDRCGNSYTCNTIKEADSYHKTNYIRAGDGLVCIEPGCGKEV